MLDLEMEVFKHRAQPLKRKHLIHRFSLEKECPHLCELSERHSIMCFCHFDFEGFNGLEVVQKCGQKKPRRSTRITFNVLKRTVAGDTGFVVQFVRWRSRPWKGTMNAISTTAGFHNDGDIILRNL
jgi:hypothetical protein